MESDEIDLSIVISTFDIGHVTKISLHCRKDQLKICGILWTAHTRHMSLKLSLKSGH